MADALAVIIYYFLKQFSFANYRIKIKSINFKNIIGEFSGYINWNIDSVSCNIGYLFYIDLHWDSYLQ